MPLKDRLHFSRVYSYPFSANDNAKVLSPLNVEFALVDIDRQVRILQPLEHFSDALVMLL